MAASSKKSKDPIVFLDVTIGKNKAGRIVLVLYAQKAPKTTSNFKAFCEGEREGRNGRILHLKDTIFNRVFKGSHIQGGDYTEFLLKRPDDGRKPEENQQGTHSRGGLISMSVDHQGVEIPPFSITIQPSTHLDDREIIFGSVLEGTHIVEKIERLPTVSSGVLEEEMNFKDRPIEDCVITDCGVLKEYERSKYTDWPDDCGVSESKLFEVVLELKAEGNEFFKNQNFEKAVISYNRSLRYLSLTPSSPTKTEKEAELEQSLRLNLAASFLKLKDWEEAIYCCNKVLEKTPKNAKALFRMGQAYVVFNDSDKAKEWLLKAVEVEPNDKSIKDELQKVNKKLDELKKDQMNVYGKMFGWKK